MTLQHPWSSPSKWSWSWRKMFNCIANIQLKRVPLQAHLPPSFQVFLKFPSKWSWRKVFVKLYCKHLTKKTPSQGPRSSPSKLRSAALCWLHHHQSLRPPSCHTAVGTVCTVQTALSSQKSSKCTLLTKKFKVHCAHKNVKNVQCTAHCALRTAKLRVHCLHTAHYIFLLQNEHF